MWMFGQRAAGRRQHPADGGLVEQAVEQVFTRKTRGSGKQDMLRRQVHDVSPFVTTKLSGPQVFCLVPTHWLGFIAQGFLGLLPAQALPVCKHCRRRPELRLGGFETFPSFTFGNTGARQFEGLLEVVGLIQRFGEQGVAEIGEISLFRTAEGHPVGARRSHDQRAVVLERGDIAT